MLFGAKSHCRGSTVTSRQYLDIFAIHLRLKQLLTITPSELCRIATVRQFLCCYLPLQPPPPQNHSISVRKPRNQGVSPLEGSEHRHKPALPSFASQDSFTSTPTFLIRRRLHLPPGLDGDGSILSLGLWRALRHHRGELPMQGSWAELPQSVCIPSRIELWRRFVFAGFCFAEKQSFPALASVETFLVSRNKKPHPLLGALLSTRPHVALPGHALNRATQLLPRDYISLHIPCATNCAAHSPLNRLPTHHSNRLGAHLAQSTSTKLLALSTRVESKSQIAQQELKLYQQH
ncbi:hypothetical protein V8F33_006391 [Rhypophila sp. PSN 637]